MIVLNFRGTIFADVDLEKIRGRPVLNIFADQKFLNISREILSRIVLFF